MTQWEFYREAIPANQPSIDTINWAGEQGWELVAVVGYGATHWMYFKRPKPVVIIPAKTVRKAKGA